MRNPAGKKILDVAVIGCGRIAQTYLEALALFPGCRLGAVADPSADAARSAAARYDCAAYSDYRELADRTPVDAVVVATPPNTHAEIAAFFLGRGIHVLSEKPFALSAGEAARMLGRAREKNCALMMASKFRYVDAVVEAQKMIASGALGEVLLFENAFCSEVDMLGRWNSDREIAGGGVLIDNGCHSVDIARFLLGPIAAVSVEAAGDIQGLGVEDTVRLRLRTASGAAGLVTLSWSLPSGREDYISLLGSEAAVSIGWGRSRRKRNREREWTDFGGKYDKLAAIKSQVENFLNSIAGREAPRVAPEDGYASVRVIEAAYRSLRLKGWVAVEPEGATGAEYP